MRHFINFLIPADSERCETCDDVLDKLETIDDDTDKHNIQFVKTDDVKLAHEIGVFSFPALVYYETGVPIMFDGDLFLRISINILLMSDFLLQVI